jgi:uncharacterized protein YjbI with pentapeptide repeats
MSNPVNAPVITFGRESGRAEIQGERHETLFQTVERNWNTLQGAVLRRFSGNRIDLCNADLRGADLYSADLTCARLFRADLTQASLYGAALAGADLQDANLMGADLYRADLRHADLRRAQITGANLERACLTDADLRDAVYDATTRFPKDFVLGDAGLCPLDDIPDTAIVLLDAA